MGCSVADSNIFKSLSKEERELLNQEKNCNSYLKGDIIYHEGNRISGCYCVNKGILKIYKTGIEGKEQIIAFAQKGDIIGYRSILSSEPACTTAQVIDDTLLCYIPSEILLSLVKSNSSFSLDLMQLTCKELNQANMYIKDIAQKTVRERLAEILLMLKTTFGEDGEGYLQIILTREDLANIVGTATESVIRLLSEFKSDNLIELSNKKIKILNLSALKKLSYDL
ncbi:cAMP-binding domain of CRP or a regulatory subunit of cAMP-dependent protein kinases [Williamwhitmania taraxaci]|uniref:cAMP-binding domain of CRP or a regulatory subunit of cAMP-dependent protein kinases n=2 Tax=Williamwhitmania taraxaci TaxID=1640674 RepID=A0A1G6GZY3_9BACT|nr:cAMP-binding domain of CRP or a regulatory subunit of cAMP-dependent protein kinases [Williamwhitmania taraxaci]